MKWTYGLSSNDYRVATLPIGNLMQSLKSIESMSKLKKESTVTDGWTDGPTLTIERLRFQKLTLIILHNMCV